MERFQYSKEFDEQYAYDGNDLGAACTPQGTHFKLWAPFADRVELNLYGKDSGKPAELCRRELEASGSPDSEGFRSLDMAKGERGVWSLYLEGDLHGCFYDYRIWMNGEAAGTADPYAVGCAYNGSPSMAVDLRRTDPEGFAEDPTPQRPVENIIYELHIKDFSHDPDSGVPEAYRGKYKAFTVETPGLGGDGQHPTGVEYLKDLGVTHVHLLPFYDYGWLDEAGSAEQFNWGYDPVNYNVPEGSYATDVRDGTVRIRECKEMIQALHRAGIRVIMDVVYNHTYEADSWLERTAPGYYCRRLADGTLADGSACGNDLAAGRRMVDNYIAGSVLYWAREYHVDGFRFDLMGLLTVELMNRIRRELDEAFGPGEKLLYGEPWRAGESPMERGTTAALKENIGCLDEGIAVFSDDTRDVIKGHVFHEREPGFVNGGQGLEEKVLRAVAGWCADGAAQGELRPKSCAQVVNYVSAHDNFTLWDKLVISLHGQGADFTIPYEDVLRANRLAALICFTCQGNLFFQAGEEFGRTKSGDDNSYRSDPKINMLRWRQTAEAGELIAYYKGLIRLRKELPGLYDKSPSAHQRILGKEVTAPGVAVFRLDNRIRAGEESAADRRSAADGGRSADCHAADTGKAVWQELFIIYNASGEEARIRLPQGEWTLLADGSQADCARARAVQTDGEGRVEVPACSGMILGRA